MNAFKLPNVAINRAAQQPAFHSDEWSNLRFERRRKAERQDDCKEIVKRGEPLALLHCTYLREASFEVGLPSLVSPASTKRALIKVELIRSE